LVGAAAALTRLAATSGGNPLCALEIARVLARRPVDPAWGEALPVPATLQELVATRVEALSDGAPSETRRRLHRRLAETVTDPDERAHHLAAGTENADADVSSELEVGATRAASRGAPDAAAGLYAAAAKLTPSGAPDDRARRLIGEAAAWNAVGDFASATALAEDALALADAAPLVIAARSLLASIAWFNGDDRHSDRRGVSPPECGREHHPENLTDRASGQVVHGRLECAAHKRRRLMPFLSRPAYR
jgi:hypothetical protein